MTSTKGAKNVDQSPKPASDPGRNIYQRIIEVYKSAKDIAKTGNIEIKGQKSYTVVTHDAVTELLHMPIAEAGLVVIPDQESCVFSEFEVIKPGYNKGEPDRITKWYRADIKATLTLVNADKPEEMVKTTSCAFALDTGDKAAGKAYSLALKAAYLKLFMLASQDNEEDRDFERREYDDWNRGPASPSGSGSKTSGYKRPDPAAPPKAAAVPSPQPGNTGASKPGYIPTPPAPPVDRAQASGGNGGPTPVDAKNESQFKGTPPGPTQKPGVSETQIRRLFTFKAAAGWTDQQLKSVIMNCFGIESTKELVPESYNRLCSLLEMKLKPDDVMEKILSKP